MKKNPGRIFEQSQFELLNFIVHAHEQRTTYTIIFWNKMEKLYSSASAREQDLLKFCSLACAVQIA
jgi:hypothetical protein